MVKKQSKTKQTNEPWGAETQEKSLRAVIYRFSGHKIVFDVHFFFFFFKKLTYLAALLLCRSLAQRLRIYAFPGSLW